MPVNIAHIKVRVGLKKEGCGYRRLAQVKSEEIWKGMEEQMQESEKAENEKGEKK